jgi:hypothetical protein
VPVRGYKDLPRRSRAAAPQQRSIDVWEHVPVVVVLLLVLTLAISPVRPAVPEERPFSWHDFAEDGSVRVNLYVFWSETCPHCHRALRFLGALEKELPWLEVEALEVSVPENVERYSALAEQVGTDARYVPAFFYCGRSFQGYDRDETTGRFLRQSLEACRAELLAQKESDGSAATDRAAAAPGAPPIDLPLIGRLQPSSHSLPVLTLMLAGLDAFNPCAFFVLLFLLSLMVHVRSRMRMALVGGVFVAFSGLLYFVFMAAWLNFFLLVGYLPLVTISAGLVALFVGTLNVKDFVWPKKGISLSIPEHAKPDLYQRTRDLVGAASLPAMLAGTVALALAANAYELLCTAGFPLVFTRILTLSDLSTPAYYGYLALYNLVYVLPLLGIVVVFAVTLGARKLKEEEGRILKLLSGLMMLGVGLVLLFAPEALSYPLTAFGLILAALAMTALVVWLARGLIGGTQQGASRIGE